VKIVEKSADDDTDELRGRLKDPGGRLTGITIVTFVRTALLGPEG
jgi:hypothetical protein